MTLLTNATQFSTADSSAMFFTIVFTIICSILAVVINRAKNKRHRHVEQAGMLITLCFLGLSLYNISITNPNAKSTCIYDKYEKVYYRNNLRHGIKNKHFNIRHINDNQTNIRAFNSAIPNTPRDAHKPSYNFWDYL